MGRCQHDSNCDVPVLTRAAHAAEPVDLPKLLRPWTDRVSGAGPLLMAVNDPHRHTDTAAVLRAIRRVLGEAVRPWRILIACGTHRFDADTRRRFESRLATEAGEIESFAWHDCRDPRLVEVGPSGRWRCHPWLVASDAAMLAVGSVEPHYFAGLTGAHKTVTIGCCDRDAIEANHAGAMSPEAQPFALGGNPVYDGVAAMVAELESIRPIVAVDLVQSGPTIHAAAVGAPTDALQQLRGAAADMFSHTLPAPADALVLHVTGPLAGSFYQADKALKNNEDAVRDGGLLILDAACPDGIGQDHFVDLLGEAAGCQPALAVVESRGYRLGDHKAVRLRRLTDPAERGVRIAAVSKGLSADDCETLGMTKCPSIAAALAADGLQPGIDRVFAVSDAGNTVVRVD